MKLTSVAKATIYKYHLGLELGNTSHHLDLSTLWERTIAVHRWWSLSRGVKVSVIKAEKGLREPGNPDLDKCVLKWFKQARDKKIPVSGHLIRSKAEQFSTEMGKTDFKASSGWLEGFKERNKISFKTICGESGAVNLQVAEQWKNNLRELIQDKEARDVFNVDETGLFFKCTPDKTLAFKHEKCHGGKLSKERVTLLVGANMDGSEKLPLLMIGKAANPRCFKNVKTKPVDYANSVRAWMTSYLFEKWLRFRSLKIKLDVLQASRLCKKAWDQVTSETIKHCFKKAGFVQKEEDEENADDIIAETMPSVDGWEDVISNPTILYDDFLNVDDDVAVCGEITDADIIAEVLNHNIEKQDGDEASGDEDESSVAGEMNVPSAAEAVTAAGMPIYCYLYGCNGTRGKATQICIACENATNQMKHVLSDSDKQVAVTKMNSKKWEDRKEPRKENTTNQSHKIIENCRNCGRSHKINQCPAYQKRCNKCKKLNHFANLCRSKNTNSYKIRQIVGSPEPEMIQEFVIQSVENTNLTEDWYEEVKIKGKKVNMKLDTGAQCNVLPLSLAGRLNLEIQRSPVKSLISFSGHRIPVEGQSLAMCMVKNMTAYIRFIISRDNTCPILGRQTCSNLGLVKRVNTCQAITQEYQELFEGIGCLKGYEYEAKFQTSDMNMQVRPPRPIPLSIKERVKKELEEMEDNGIIKKVNYPTPISSQMVIAKQKGKIRICIDPSDINKVILRSHFPLRTFDQIAVNLHGSKYFTKLDLKKGYWQIKKYSRKIMADLLQDLEGTENSMDDILIHAPDPQTLEIRTRAVLQRLKENGIKLNRDKCKFQLQEVQFLGHIVTTEGIKIDPEKVRAIGEIKSPSNKQELQRLLGMVQYLSRFIPNLAEKTKNMRLLLKKDTPWLWDESLDRDLLEIKTLLRTAPTLKFFNPNGNLTLSVDASSYALGAVLLQNGKPIAYASSALNSTQQNYAQIEKEALAIKFGCDKFHQLIYGKTVDVETDHRPLETIFKKPLSKAPPRLQRIFLQIQQYDLRIKYKKGKELLTADLLSRDCSYEDTYLEENFEVLMTTPTNKSSYEELQALTKEDQELQELKNLILYGWPNYKSAVPESCKKYWPYRDELSTNEDLIFKGSRVFIPLKWKAKILKLIHEGHQGTNSCLRRARDSIYWHGMSQDIINTVENCRTCQANQRNKTKEPMIIKEIPSLPWEIVAADIFSIKGKNYLLITDNYSGFIDFKEMKTMNSAETIESLKKWFSVHGIPRLLETDNGPNFTSRDFKDFQKKWLFDHQTSSPLYPKSNGLAERAVQTAKILIRKCLDSGQEVELALLNFYNTPRDGLPSPAQCLFSRRTRTLLPTSTHQLEPEIQKGHTQNLRNKRERQKTHHDKTAKTTRSFKEGEKIMLKQHHREWIPARVTQEVAPRSYKVQTPTGEYRRNSSFMRHTNLESPKQQRRRIPEIPKSTLPEGPGPSGDKEQAQVPEELNTSPRPFTGQEPRSDHQNAEHKNGTLPITTRSGRIIKPPQTI
ncbi:K02A2.6-like [Cordylochernes scorpioides]|uniref:RNA-directed DNA polymerase n=1 Tax=Cordylochernes scorpioides TaxID=51811 RepID=A0ABY6LB44_9ARAC|nr:K02A2.6-like [Cordylochernes scorpioides]